VLLAGDALLVELYGFEPATGLPPHRHVATEHVWTVLSGEARVCIGGRWMPLRQGEVLLIPAGQSHGIHNPKGERLACSR
jgi:quercetin dioxygenase-like cupin family protein